MTNQRYAQASRDSLFQALLHRMSANQMDSGEATLGIIQEFLGRQRKTTTEDYLKTLDRGAADVADIIDPFDQKSEQDSAQHEE